MLSHAIQGLQVSISGRRCLVENGRRHRRTPIFCHRLEVSTSSDSANEVACALREVYTDAEKLDEVDSFAGAHFGWKMPLVSYRDSSLG